MRYEVKFQLAAIADSVPNYSAFENTEWSLLYGGLFIICLDTLTLGVCRYGAGALGL